MHLVKLCTFRLIVRSEKYLVKYVEMFCLSGHLLISASIQAVSAQNCDARGWNWGLITGVAP